MAEATDPEATRAQHAVQVLSTLCNLIIDACRSDSRQTLIFKILNSSVHLVGYDRAVLWDLERPHPQLLGVSGQPDTNRTTALAKQLTALAEVVAGAEATKAFGADDFPDESHPYHSLAQQNPGLALLWVPISSHGRIIAGLWLERWGSEGWRENETKIMGSLADGYGAAWERFALRQPWRTRLRQGSAKGAAALVILAVAVFFLFLRPLPMRVVAPCEVIPKDPFVVTAPLDGVVQEVMVAPGDPVEPGDLLFVYDKELALQEVEVAKQQVEEVQEKIEYRTAVAFNKEEVLAEIAVLKHRLAQEKLRLELAQHIESQLEVRAKIAGVAMLTSPHEWRGRPVRTGERVITIIDPADTAVRIWMAQDDNVGLNRALAVDVFLHATPHKSQRAKIAYVAPSTSMSPGGVPGFLVEADWLASSTVTRPGLKGTAVLYGPPASLAYWVLRKPWTTVRRSLGW